MNVGTLNCNSLINKVYFIYNFLAEHDISVLSVSETWLISSVSTSFVDVPGYRFYRGDVSGGVRKHGTGIYILDSVSAYQVPVDLDNVAVVYLDGFSVYIVLPGLFSLFKYTGLHGEVDFIDKSAKRVSRVNGKIGQDLPYL